MAKKPVEGLVELPSFANQFQPRDRVRKTPGNSEHVLYSSRVADDGTVELIKSGVEDIYASIQSHKDSCDINVLLARYKNGDVDALSRVQGTYGDFVGMPTTYAEILNSVIKGEELFNSLPVETRAKFDHSLEKFLVAMDDMPSWLEKVGVKNDGQASRSDEEGSVPSGRVEPEPKAE